jgi:hypothetical protein
VRTIAAPAIVMLIRYGLFLAGWITTAQDITGVIVKAFARRSLGRGYFLAPLVPVRRPDDARIVKRSPIAADHPTGS